MRKIITLVLCLLMVCGLAVTASAATQTTVSVNPTTVNPGDTITVTYNVQCDDPVNSVAILPTFDDSYFSLVGGTVSGFDGSFLKDYYQGAFAVAFQNKTACSGTMTLTLKALKPGKGLPIGAQFSAIDNEGFSKKETITGPSVTIGCNHSWGDWTVTSAATCTSEGKRERVCSICGEKQTETIGKKAHTPGEWEKVSDPTCTEKGKSVQKCKVCGQEMDARYTDATGHKPAKDYTVVKEPTCTEPGKQTKICTVCKAVLEEKEIPATGHKEGEWEITKQPDCETEGEKVQKCTVCQVVLKTEKIPAAGHKPAEDSEIVKEPTCEEDGLMSGKCSVCGKILKDEVIPALGHDYQLKEEKKPTCTEKGSKLYVCSRDEKHTKTEEVEALGHKWGSWADEGSGKHARTCERCDVKESAEHTWDTGKVTTEATCSKPGEKTFACTVCKATKTETIPATGEHDFTKKYTDNGDGTHTAYCDCGEEGETSKHAYTQEGDILVKPTTSKEGTQEMLCVCGAKTTKTLPKIHANYDDVPKTGDITGQLVLGGGAVIALLAAAVYVLKRRLAR